MTILSHKAHKTKATRCFRPGLAEYKEWSRTCSVNRAASEAQFLFFKALISFIFSACLHILVV